MQDPSRERTSSTDRDTRHRFNTRLQLRCFTICQNAKTPTGDRQSTIDCQPPLRRRHHRRHRHSRLSSSNHLCWYKNNCELYHWCRCCRFFRSLSNAVLFYNFLIHQPLCGTTHIHIYKVRRLHCRFCSVYFQQQQQSSRRSWHEFVPLETSFNK